MCTMEGILWKWTNYWNGWQTRWFILENDILSYYKSQDEVKQGCKGAIKLHACEINVSSIDMTRMDLVIPGERHIYIRAATPQERQQWLVALGTAKACINKNQKVSNDTALDNLNTKKSELRLYCDLLMQQVHMVKTSVNESEELKVQLDEATSLLTATCDTFIKTLEECMSLSNANLNYKLPIHNDSQIPSVHRKNSRLMTRSNSYESQ